MKAADLPQAPLTSAQRDWFKPLVIVCSLVIVILILAITLLVGQPNFGPQNQKSTTSQAQEYSDQNRDLGDINSTDPIEIGKALAGGNCSGTGSKELINAPMDPTDLSVIIPYGLTAGSHVTPIDHQYYWGKVQMGDPDMYNVFAPADGKIVNISYRDRGVDTTKVKGDYRIVIMYSCTFFSYYDLMTSMSAKINAALPPSWEQNQNNLNVDIPIAAGEVIGKVGGQSLDFAVWDTTKRLSNLLVPQAYSNAEPWKLHTVAPLDYFSAQIKSQIVPFYPRTVEPIDGRLDYDQDGYVVGNWFLEGTNGYAGVFAHGASGGGMPNYWSGHLSLAPDHLDPTGWIFSHGNIAGNAMQFAIKSPVVLPNTLNLDSGLVKYELADVNYVDGAGLFWRGERAAAGITLQPTTTKATALVQMLDTRKIKVEVFMGQLPPAVTGFTAQAQIFDRGDNAKMITSNTRR